MRNLTLAFTAVLTTNLSVFSLAQIFIPVLHFLSIGERISHLYHSYQKNLTLPQYHIYSGNVYCHVWDVIEYAGSEFPCVSYQEAIRGLQGADGLSTRKYRIIVKFSNKIYDILTQLQKSTEKLNYRISGQSYECIGNIPNIHKLYQLLYMI